MTDKEQIAILVEGLRAIIAFTEADVTDFVDTYPDYENLAAEVEFGWPVENRFAVYALQRAGIDPSVF